MAQVIRLTVNTGPHKGARFCFRGPTSCLAGRSSECFLHFCGTERDQMISRFHCQLQVDPPLVRLQDLASRNGTYVNGQRVGPMAAPALFEGGAAIGAAGDGDVITLGGRSLRVDIVECEMAGGDAVGAPVWGCGETAKKDCVMTCPDGARVPLPVHEVRGCGTAVAAVLD